MIAISDVGCVSVAQFRTDGNHMPLMDAIAFAGRRSGPKAA